MFHVTKTYPHSLGLSACFRQWRAKSHCRLLHGYPLSFKITFSSYKLNENNWVLDLGSLKPIKKFLIETFDHKLLVARDDPYRDELTMLGGLGLADPLVLDYVGCEAFAALVFTYTHAWLHDIGEGERVAVDSVECREHEGNSAIYQRSF